MRLNVELMTGQMKESLRAWLIAMLSAAREPDAPTFKIAGPRTLQWRSRTPSKKNGVTPSVVNYAFMGDEKFRLSTVHMVEEPHSDQRIIEVILMPVSISLAAETSGVKLGLEEAFEAFEGLQEWCMGLLKEPLPGVKEPPPPVEDFVPREPSRMRGSW